MAASRNIFGWSAKEKAREAEAVRRYKEIGETARRAAGYHAGQRGATAGRGRGSSGASGRLKTPDELNREFLDRQGGGTKRLKSATFKGRKIQELADGSWVVPSIDRESRFDSLQDAKAFIGDWKRNPTTGSLNAIPPKGLRLYSDLEAKELGRGAASAVLVPEHSYGFKWKLVRLDGGQDYFETDDEALHYVQHHFWGYEIEKRNPVTDRAHRYRANNLMPSGPKVCALCDSRKNVVPDHIDGHPDHTTPGNLQWLCKSCNTAKGFWMRDHGKGRLTHQYNPAAKEPPTYEQYLWAVAHQTGREYVPGKGWTKGDHGEAGAIIHATPKTLRSEYASRAAGLSSRTKRARADERWNPDPNESVQDRSWREWGENFAKVSAKPEAASDKDLRRAIGYLDHARRSVIRRAQEAGRQVDPNVLAGYDNEYQYYVSLVRKREAANPAKFDRCVEDVQARGGDVNAYAVCSTSLSNPRAANRFQLIAAKYFKQIEDKFNGRVVVKELRGESPHVEGFDDGSVRMYIKNPTTANYLHDFLHECAHLLMGHQNMISGKRDSGNISRLEAEAEEWARNVMSREGVPISKSLEAETRYNMASAVLEDVKAGHKPDERAVRMAGSQLKRGGMFGSKGFKRIKAKYQQAHGELPTAFNPCIRTSATRRNPESSSAALYESFHGVPSTSTLEVEELEADHEHLIFDFGKLRQSNPAKFDRCVEDVQARGGDVNAYAVCTAAGTRNPTYRGEHVTLLIADGGEAFEYKSDAEQFAAALRDKRTWATIEPATLRDRVGPQFNWVVRSGAKRRNPESSSAALYESFHGVPSTSTLEVEELEADHGHLALLGRLVDCWVITLTGFLAHFEFDEDPPVWCSSAESGRQLYFVGGDQAIDLAAFKMDGEEWIKDRMVIGQFAPPMCGKCGIEFEKRGKKFHCTKCGRSVTYDDHGPKDVVYNLGYHTSKKFSDEMEEFDYQHDLGEESGVRPMLEYDPRSKHLYVTGGQYRIEQPLFETSPGIEN